MPSVSTIFVSLAEGTGGVISRDEARPRGGRGADGTGAVMVRLGWVGFALALALVLRREVFQLGWIAEDFVQAAMVEGWWSSRRVAIELYHLAPRDPELRARHLEIGALPWWTPPEFQFAPLRPLASLDVWVSHALFPGRPWLHHLHSALWLGAYLAAAARLARAWFGEWPARFAVVLLAVDASLLLPLVWTANRGVLLTGTFVAMALGRHAERTRSIDDAKRGRPAFDPRELLWWCLAFATGEYALVGVGLLVAWIGCVTPGGAIGKLRAARPAGVAFSGFAVAYVLLGSGISGHALYDGPIERPLEWLAVLPSRWLALVSDAFSGVPLDPRAPWPLRWQLAALAPWPAVLAWWWVGREAAATRRVLAASLGILVAVLPLTGVQGSPRLLAVPAIIVCALSGRLLVDLVDSGRASIQAALAARGRSPLAENARTWGAGVVSLLFAAALLGHAVVEGVDTHLRAEVMARLDEEEQQRWQHPGLRALDGRDVVMVSAPDSYTAIFGRAVLAERSNIRPRRVFVLTQTAEAILLRRNKGQRLSLDVLGGGFDLRDPEEPLFWRAPLAKGDAVDAGPLHVRVGGETETGRISRLEVSFAPRVPLGDAVLLVFEGRRFVPMPMPPVGGQVIVPARGGRVRPPQAP